VKNKHLNFFKRIIINENCLNELILKLKANLKRFKHKIRVKREGERESGMAWPQRFPEDNHGPVHQKEAL